MRKQVLVPENVEMADIHAIQTRVKKHNLLTVVLLIPLFAGCALRESHETLGGIVFVLSIALMVLSFISGRGDEKRLPAYWAKYQQIHRMDNLLRANLVGVWLCAEARVAVYREGSGYRVQLGVLDEKTGAWENDEQDEVFPTLADVREYATQEGYEPMDVDFEQMTDEEFQQFLDRSRILMKKKREENVELADIQAVRERMTQWAIRLWLLLIPVIVGIILSTQGESTARAGNFIVRIAFLLILMGAGYVAYLRNLERKYWAKYQQIHRMDNLPIDDVHKYLAQAGTKVDLGKMTDEEFQQFLDAHRL